MVELLVCIHFSSQRIVQITIPDCLIKGGGGGGGVRVSADIL